MNPPWNESEDKLDENFEKALKLVGDEFIDRLKYYNNSWIPAQNLVRDYVKNRYEVCYLMYYKMQQKFFMEMF